MPYLPATALSADETTGSDLLVAIDQRTQAMQQKLDEAERWRKWSTIIAAGSALFAAAKVGIIAIPHIRQLRQGRQLGSLGLATNPGRRRRRARRR